MRNEDVLDELAKENFLNIEIQKFAEFSNKEMREKSDKTPIKISGPTREMIDRYKEQYNKPFERDGRKYKYNIPTIEPQLKTTEINNLTTEIDDIITFQLPYQRRMLNDEIDDLKKNELEYENLQKRLRNELYDDYQRKKTRIEIEQKGRDIEKNRNEINTIQNNIKAYEQDSNELSLERNKLTIENNKDLERYADELRILNEGRVAINPKLPEETDEEYSNRLKSIKDIEYNNDEGELNARLYNINLFKDNMKEINNIEWINENVLKDIGVENASKINTRWPLFKTQILNLYGINNKNIGPNEYVDAIYSFLKIGTIDETKIQPVLKALPPEQSLLQSEIKEKKYIENSSSFVKPEKALIENPPEQALIENSSSSVSKKDSYEYKIIDNNMTLKITKNGEKSIFFKLAYATDKNIDKDIVVLYSFTGLKKSFREIIYKPSLGNPQTYDDSLAVLLFNNKKGLGVSRDDAKSLFNIGNYDNPLKQEFIEKIKRYNLNILPFNETFKYDKQGSNIFKPTKLIGYGVKLDEIPKYCDFGKVKIMMHKLYYNNILSVKDKNNINIPGFKNHRVTNKFVNVIMKICNGEDFINEYNKLSKSDIEVYNQLIFLSGTHKKKIFNTINNTINDLKERLQLVEGEIIAGNDNDEIKKELYHLLHKLANFGVITKSTAKKRYKEFVDNYFN